MHTGGRFHGTGPPFRGFAIPGIRVRVRVRVRLVTVNPSGPPEWRTGIVFIAVVSDKSRRG